MAWDTQSGADDVAYMVVGDTQVDYDALAGTLIPAVEPTFQAYYVLVPVPVIYFSSLSWQDSFDRNEVLLLHNSYADIHRGNTMDGDGTLGTEVADTLRMGCTGMETVGMDCKNFLAFVAGVMGLISQSTVGLIQDSGIEKL